MQKHLTEAAPLVTSSHLLSFADAYKPSDWVCRESMGACDKEEKCTGTGPQCPPDAKQPTNHVCRPKKDK